MADYESLQSSKINYKHLTSSIFTSPRLFTGLISKSCNEIDSTMSSPTSILDSKPFSALKTPSKSQSPTKQQCKSLWEKFDSKAVGLALVDALIDEKPDPNSPKPGNRMVVFGSQLKIQVPPLPSSVFAPDELPNSPSDFGIKTRNSFSPRFSPSPVKKSPFGSMNSGCISSLSASEMELSEDYTCVISYGPNPRTTHIFDDCVVESCCGVVKFSESRKENVNVSFSDRSMSYPSESFLSFCYNCKKNLGQGKDIYMYRGEKAFCSSDCRFREMMLEEERGPEASDSDDAYGTPS
ncbi:hypothetical protein ACS0TY_027500 [Phlomoides rotata]